MCLLLHHLHLLRLLLLLFFLFCDKPEQLACKAITPATPARPLTHKGTSSALAERLKQELLIDFHSTHKSNNRDFSSNSVGIVVGLLTGLGHKLYLRSNLEPSPGFFYVCSVPDRGHTSHSLLHFHVCYVWSVLAVAVASLSNLPCLLAGFFLPN